MMIKMKRWGVGIIIFMMVLFIWSVSGMLNPATVYCEELGYEYVIEETPQGEMGICKFPDDTSCTGWDFLKGKCGEGYSYCEKKGYGLKTISDTEKCLSIFSEECAVCVLENGNEVEVTELMELDTTEGTCGDGICVLGESYEKCPDDCPSGSFDGYCDKVRDRKCDPDCVDQGIAEMDPDCITATTITQTTTTQETLGERCGNDICEYLRGESHFTCPEDCDSGYSDGYCDKVKDGKCDPDCEGGEDPDCGFGYLLGYLPYLAVLFVIIIIVFIIYKRMREE